MAMRANGFTNTRTLVAVWANRSLAFQTTQLQYAGNVVGIMAAHAEIVAVAHAACVSFSAFAAADIEIECFACGILTAQLQQSH